MICDHWCFYYTCITNISLRVTSYLVTNVFWVWLWINFANVSLKWICSCNKPVQSIESKVSCCRKQGSLWWSLTYYDHCSTLPPYCLRPHLKQQWRAFLFKITWPSCIALQPTSVYINLFKLWKQQISNDTVDTAELSLLITVRQLYTCIFY